MSRWACRVQSEREGAPVHAADLVGVGTPDVHYRTACGRRLSDSRFWDPVVEADMSCRKCMRAVDAAYDPDAA